MVGFCGGRNLFESFFLSLKIYCLRLTHHTKFELSNLLWNESHIVVIPVLLFTVIFPIELDGKCISNSRLIEKEFSLSLKRPWVALSQTWRLRHDRFMPIERSILVSYTINSL